MPQDWYVLHNTDHLVTPSLVVYPERISKNIATMIKMAGGPSSLRPHVKTYKMADIVNMQLDQGIDKFKCATIAEAELLAICKVKDVLLAMQPVGATIDRYVQLTKKYADTTFSTLVDNIGTIDGLQAAASKNGMQIHVWLDVNNGMNRTGIPPDSSAVKCYTAIAESPNLTAKGLHVYDGHFRNPDFQKRKTACDTAFEQVEQLKDDIIKLGMEVPDIVVGGSPTFPVHCKRKNVQKSPGTTLLWDQGYSDILPELDFECAAVLITRIVSKPAPNHFCLDLGHKSVAPEMPFPRVKFLNLESKSEQIKHSEEHLVVRSENSNQYNVGDLFYAIPYHICPTVARYDEVYVARNNQVEAVWKVAARSNKITI
ncbi:D-TA family PLP-dependent enzyme [Flagellimonas lutaonensis]|uniref:Threonine aldolase n=1 Tax=Flagellimonas lutaonensis TaxID=516051 RepID=A0A0D5YXF5_9FLAO|nr:D-TA family PLP-dependent enzyme [Allomuricauda lutaonensis]AKA36554.1 threonine aldolase [Allomuricauda lutaonensis]